MIYGTISQFWKGEEKHWIKSYGIKNSRARHWNEQLKYLITNMHGKFLQDEQNVHGQRLTYYRLRTINRSQLKIVGI